MDKNIVQLPNSHVSEAAQSIADYIASGLKPATGKRLGLELEHFVFETADGWPVRRVFYDDDTVSGKPGVESLLREIAKFYDSETPGTGEHGRKHIIGLQRENLNITLEPGAQLETSIGPCDDLICIERLYNKFRAEIDPILAKYNYSLITVGYDPVDLADDVPLIPKKRYDYMDAHFRRIGWGGISMMRASASAQVSIDFHDLDDAILKFRVANAISPFLYFLFDNSPIFEGVTVEHQRTENITARHETKRMVRAMIWDHSDSDRAMTAPHIFAHGYDFVSFANGLLKSTAIFDYANESAGYLHDLTFSDLYGRDALTTEQIEHILSLFFYDVRFKTYIELRQPDSMPINYALGFAALVKGLLYNQDTLNELVEYIVGIDIADIVEAKAALRSFGYDATVYGRKADKWLGYLVKHAKHGLPANEVHYLKPVADLVDSRQTLLDLKLPICEDIA